MSGIVPFEVLSQACAVVLRSGCESNECFRFVPWLPQVPQGLCAYANLWEPTQLANGDDASFTIVRISLFP